VVENGSGFVKPLIEALDRAYRIMPQEFEEHPVAAFKRNTWVHPFLEDDVVGVVDVLGADHVLFGSDFPHPEGIGDPITFVDKLETLPADDIRKIMGGNMQTLMGTPVPA
jgi:predicted TIM-barrel fold metal-dependent hydrolase